MLKFVKRNNGVYYAEGMQNGKRYHQSLKSNNKQLAYEKFIEFCHQVEFGMPSPKVRQNRDIVKISDLQREYLKGKKPHIVQYAKTVFQRLIKFTGDIPITDITQPMVRSYLHKYRELAQSTQSHYTDTLRGAFRFAHKLDWITADPLASLERVRVKKNQRTDYFTLEEIAKIKKQTGFDRDIVVFLLETGMRTGELVKLKFSDCELNPKNNLPPFAHIKNPLKGGVQHIVPLSADAVDIIKRNWNEYGKAEYSDFCFISKTGKPFDKHIQRTIKQFFQRIKMPTALRVLQEVLGHSTIQMTMRYAHLMPPSVGQILQNSPY